MGNTITTSITTVKKELENEEQSEDSSRQSQELVKEKLEFLSSMVKYKLDAMHDEIEELFSAPTSDSRVEFPGIQSWKWLEESYLNVSNVQPDKICEIADTFLGHRNTNEDLFDDFKALVISSATQFIIKSEPVGEVEDRRYFVYWFNNTLVRVDVWMWKYNFSGPDSVLHNVDNLFTVVLCLSIIDRKKMNLSDLPHLLSSYPGIKGELIDQYCDKLKSLWEEVRKPESRTVRSVVEGSLGQLKS